MRTPGLLAPLALLAACAAPAPAPGPAAPADTLHISLTDPRDSFAVTLSRELGRRPATWHMTPGQDPLELLATGVPALVSRDRQVVAAASGTTGYRTTTLGWDRTYVLVPGRRGFPAPQSELDRHQYRRDLANAAVRADARPSEPPYAWEPRPLCGEAPPLVTSARARIVYPAGDETARALAERLAAIHALWAEPLAPRELGFSVADGREAAAVLPFIQHPRAEWPVATLPCATPFVPLIDTRATLIQRADGG